MERDPQMKRDHRMESDDFAKLNFMVINTWNKDNFKKIVKKSQQYTKDMNERIKYIVDNKEDLWHVINHPEPKIKNELIGYKITKDGRIWNVKRSYYMKQTETNGYMTLSIGASRKKHTVHRLVAMTFLVNSDPEKKVTVNHKDYNKLNNHVDNLEWCTQKESLSDHGKKTSHERDVVRLDMTGKIVEYYATITEAARTVGKDRAAINKICLGINKKDKEGYTWKYVDEKHGYHKDVNVSEAKPVYDYTNYFVFRDGRVYNKVTKRFLKNMPNKSGYVYVTLCKGSSKAKGNGGKSHKENRYMHRIVADHWIDNPGNKGYVNHKNKVRHDNRVENLEWVTHSENMLHAKSKNAK